MKKILSVLLIAAALFSLVACGGGAATTQSEQKKEYTREELQQIVVQTALAYYYQNPDVQYDSWQLGEEGLGHCTSGDSPEVASPDTQIYSVCSNYMYDIYYDAFGYKLMGSPTGVGTKKMVGLTTENPMVKFDFEGSKDKQARVDAMNATRDVLQPGDLVVYYAKSAGHVMMYVGDCLGDGVKYGIHCWGSKYDYETGEESYESNGAIYLQPIEELFYDENNKNGPKCYLAAENHSLDGLSVLRPFDAADFPGQPTPQALSRVKYLGIKVDRELDRSSYNSVENGTALPVTVSITNNGTADYTDLAVTENLPQGQTLVDGSVTEGAKIDGSTISWSLTVPAGKTVSVGYQLQVNGAVGDTVTLPAGSVDNLTTPEISIVISGKHMNDAQQKALVAAAKELAEKGTDAAQTDIFNELYRKAFGVELNLPKTTEALADSLVVADTPLGLDKRLYMRKTDLTGDAATLAKMIIKDHVGGHYYYREGNPRSAMIDFYGFGKRYETGDILVGTYNLNKVVLIDDESIDYFVILGDKVLAYNKKDGFKLAPYNGTVGLAMKYNLLIGLRPSQAFDNLFGN